MLQDIAAGRYCWKCKIFLHVVEIFSWKRQAVETPKGLTNKLVCVKFLSAFDYLDLKICARTSYSVLENVIS